MPQLDKPNPHELSVTVVVTSNKENARNAQFSCSRRLRCSYTQLTLDRLAIYEDFLTHSLLDSVGSPWGCCGHCEQLLTPPVAGWYENVEVF